MSFPFGQEWARRGETWGRSQGRQSQDFEQAQLKSSTDVKLISAVRSVIIDASSPDISFDGMSVIRCVSPCRCSRLPQDLASEGSKEVSVVALASSAVECGSENRLIA